MSAEPEPVYEPEPDESWSLAEALEFHLARIARHEAVVAEMDAECDRMLERYRRWHERRTGPHKEKAAQSREMAAALMLEAVERDPRAAKSMELPSGTITTRKGATVVAVADFEALKAWSLEFNPAVLRWKPEPAVDVIKEALANGEAVPGVELVTKDRTVSIKVGGL